MSKRKDKLVNNEFYHILNKSIEGYVIYNTVNDYQRMINLLYYYQNFDIPCKYSDFCKLGIDEQTQILNAFRKYDNKLVEIIAYCIMPTHYHLVLKQLVNNGISNYIAKISNSYSSYFNLKHHRKGPLWQGRFKNILIENDEQLLHLTRYIHLNPVTSNLVDNPINWKYSSYREYLQETNNKLCNFDILNIKTGIYKRFVLSQKNYQRELHVIKKQITE